MFVRDRQKNLVKGCNLLQGCRKANIESTIVIELRQPRQAQSRTAQAEEPKQPLSRSASLGWFIYVRVCGQHGLVSWPEGPSHQFSDGSAPHLTLLTPHSGLAGLC